MAAGFLLKTAKAALPYLLIIGIAAFMLHDIFQPGILTKSDNAVHMVEASFLADTAFPKYHWITGWYQNESGGMPLQLYFYQFGYWIILFLYFVFHIPMELAYKLVLLFAYVFPALALYFLLSKKFGRIAAFFPSLFYLFQIDNTKMFLAGMWNNGIGLGFLVLLFYSLDKSHKNINIRSATVMGFVFGAVILSHYLVAIAAAGLFMAYLLAGKENFPKKLFFYSYAVTFGGMLTLFYTYPLIETAGWLVFNIGWGLGRDIVTTIYALVGIFLSAKPLLPAVQQAIAANYVAAGKEFFTGILQNLPMFTIDLLAILGLAYFAKNKTHKEHDFLKTTLLFAVVMLILGSGFWFLSPQLSKLPFLSSILAYRFLYYGRITLMIFAAFAISQIFRKAELPKNIAALKIIFRHKNKLAVAYVVVFAILLLSGIFFPPKDFVETSGRFALTGEIERTLDWLSENVDSQTERVLFQGFFGNIKDSALPVYYIYNRNISTFGAWANTQSPVQMAATAEDSKLFNKTVSSISPEEIYEKSKAYNIKYFVAVEPKLRNKLAGLDFFKSEKKLEHFEIFTVKNFVSEFVESENKLNYGITEFDDNKIAIKISNTYENNVAGIKLTYHPYWHAFADGKELELQANKHGLMEIVLPAGNYELKLVYEPTKLLWPTFAAIAFAVFLFAANFLTTLRKF